MNLILGILGLLVAIAALVAATNVFVAAKLSRNSRGVLTGLGLLALLFAGNALIPVAVGTLVLSGVLAAVAFKSLAPLLANEAPERAKARSTETQPTLLLNAIALAAICVFATPAWVPTTQKTTELVKAKDGSPAKLWQAITGPFAGNPVAELETLPDGQVQAKAMFNEGAVNNQAPPRALPRTDLQPLQTVTQTTLIGLGVGTLLLLVVFQGLLQKRGSARTETSVS